jgi:Reverse transcriptase (RNA-dependent DNA polymerase)
MWSLEADGVTRDKNILPEEPLSSQSSPFSIGMLDNGANATCTNIETAKKLGREIRYYETPAKINFGGVREMECTMYADFGEILGEVTIVENLPKTLVPAIPFLDRGFATIYMKGRGFIISKTGKIITVAKQHRDGLFYFELEPIVKYKEEYSQQQGDEDRIKTVKDLIQGLTMMCSEATGCEALEFEINASRRDRRLPKELVLKVLWLHRCMNHVSPQIMATAIRNGSWINIPQGITAALIENVFAKMDCPACAWAKWHKLPTPIGSGIKPTMPGASLSVDYKGPIKPPAYGGFNGFFIFYDDATGMIKTYLVKLKSEFSAKIRIVHAFYKRYGHRVEKMRFDAGTVENSKEAADVMDELGIVPSGMLKESQYQNAVERAIQTLVDKVGASMVDQSILGRACWGMAVLHHETTSNATPNVISTPDTPQNMVMRIMPDLDNAFYFPFASLVSVSLLGPHNVMLEGRNEFRAYVGSNINRAGGVLTYKPASGIHVPDLRNNAQLVKMPQRMLTADDLVKRKPIVSTDNSIEFFSSVDEDVNISVESLKQVLEEDMSGNKMFIARHNEAMSQNEDKAVENQEDEEEEECKSSISRRQLARGHEEAAPKEVTRPDQGIDAMDPRFCEYQQGMRITRSKKTEGYNPDQHYAEHRGSISSAERPKADIKTKLEFMKQDVKVLENTLRVTELMLKCFAAKKKLRGDHNPTLSKAYRQEEWNKWHNSIDTELKTLVDFGTGIRVDRSDVPVGMGITPCKIELLKKIDAEGNYDKHKARLVVMSNLARTAVFDQVFAPCANPCTFKMVLAIATRDNLALSEFDVKAAFLNADLNKPYFVSLPPELFDGEDVVWLLQKSLYGLKEAARIWYDEYAKWVIHNGHKRSEWDHCLFISRWAVEKVEHVVISLCHVDNILTAASHKEDIDVFHQMLQMKWTITRKDKPTSVLGIHLLRHHNGSMTLLQDGYLDKVLRDENLEDCTQVIPSPMSANTSHEYNDSFPRCDQTSYITLLGKLIVFLISRPEQQFPIKWHAMRSQKCTTADYDGLRRILKYIQCTRHYGLTFHPESPEQRDQAYQIITCADAAYRSHPDSKSQTGALFFMGPNNGAFHAISQKQTTVAESSCEAENDASCTATKALIWMRGIMKELGGRYEQKEPNELATDSEPNITISSDYSGNHKRTKHFLHKISFLIDNIKTGVIRLQYLKTIDMPANMLTKPTAGPEFTRFMTMILGTSATPQQARSKRPRTSEIDV